MMRKWTRPKRPRPTNPSNLISTFLSPLASQQFQMCLRCRGRVGHAPEIVTSRVAYDGEMIHIPEGRGGKIGQGN